MKIAAGIYPILAEETGGDICVVVVEIYKGTTLLFNCLVKASKRIKGGTIRWCTLIDGQDKQACRIREDRNGRKVLICA